MKKIPFLYCYFISKLIKQNGITMTPADFKIFAARSLHLEKEYAIVVLKELVAYGLVKEYSPEEIVFNDEDSSMRILMEE